MLRLRLVAVALIAMTTVLACTPSTGEQASSSSCGVPQIPWLATNETDNGLTENRRQPSGTAWYDDAALLVLFCETDTAGPPDVPDLVDDKGRQYVSIGTLSGEGLVPPTGVVGVYPGFSHAPEGLRPVSGETLRLRQGTPRRSTCASKIASSDISIKACGLMTLANWRHELPRKFKTPISQLMAELIDEKPATLQVPTLFNYHARIVGSTFSSELLVGADCRLGGHSVKYRVNSLYNIADDKAVALRKYPSFVLTYKAC